MSTASKELGRMDRQTGSDRTVCKVGSPETSPHGVKPTHCPQCCGNSTCATTKKHHGRYRCEEPPGDSASTSNPKRDSSRFCRL
jgi:hypothetical protein